MFHCNIIQAASQKFRPWRPNQAHPDPRQAGDDLLNVPQVHTSSEKVVPRTPPTEELPALRVSFTIHQVASYSAPDALSALSVQGLAAERCPSSQGTYNAVRETSNGQMSKGRNADKRYRNVRYKILMTT